MKYILIPLVVALIAAIISCARELRKLRIDYADGNSAEMAKCLLAVSRLQKENSEYGKELSALKGKIAELEKMWPTAEELKERDRKEQEMLDGFQNMMDYSIENIPGLNMEAVRYGR